MYISNLNRCMSFGGVFRRFLFNILQWLQSNCEESERASGRANGRMPVRVPDFNCMNDAIQISHYNFSLLIRLLVLSEFDHMKQKILWDVRHSREYSIRSFKAHCHTYILFLLYAIGTLNLFECRSHSNFGSGWLPHSVCNVYFISLVSRLHFYSKTNDRISSLTQTQLVYTHTAAGRNTSIVVLFK